MMMLGFGEEQAHNNNIKEEQKHYTQHAWSQMTWNRSNRANKTKESCAITLLVWLFLGFSLVKRNNNNNNNKTNNIIKIYAKI